jgi:hypothetical protein
VHINLYNLEKERYQRHTGQNTKFNPIPIKIKCAQKNVPNLAQFYARQYGM